LGAAVSLLRAAEGLQLIDDGLHLVEGSGHARLGLVGLRLVVPAAAPEGALLAGLVEDISDLEIALVQFLEERQLLVLELLLGEIATGVLRVSDQEIRLPVSVPIADGELEAATYLGRVVAIALGDLGARREEHPWEAESDGALGRLVSQPVDGPLSGPDQDIDAAVTVPVAGRNARV